MLVEDKINRLLGDAKAAAGVKQTSYLKSILKDKDKKVMMGKLEGMLKSVASKYKSALTLSATNIEGEPFVNLGDMSKPDSGLVKDVEAAVKKAGFNLGKKAYNQRGSRYEIYFGDALR